MSEYFNVVIEKDEDGYLVASVPSLKGCHTQGKTMNEVLERITEAIELVKSLPESEQEKITLSMVNG